MTDESLRQPMVTIDWAEITAAAPATPLQQCGVLGDVSESETLSLSQLTRLGLVRLNSLQPFEVLRSGLAAHNLPLSSGVNQCLGEDPSVLCLAPHEWLFFSEFLGPERLLAAILPAIDPDRSAVLDVTDALAVFRLAGAAAPWLLNKLCGLDLQGRQQLGPHCARTRLQDTPLTLHYRPAEGQTRRPVFDLLCDRSLARYTWELLLRSQPHAEELYRHHGSFS